MRQRRSTLTHHAHSTYKSTTRRNDARLHQISQILDRRTWASTATVAHTYHAGAGAERWQEQNRPGVRVAAPTSSAAAGVEPVTRCANYESPICARWELQPLCVWLSYP